MPGPQSSPRYRELMELAAAALEDGRSPFDHAFLVEHRVTFNEAGALADGVAASIRLALAMIPPRRRKIVIENG